MYKKNKQDMYKMYKQDMYTQDMYKKYKQDMYKMYKQHMYKRICTNNIDYVRSQRICITAPCKYMHCNR